MTRRTAAPWSFLHTMTAMSLTRGADVVLASHQPLREVVAGEIRRLILDGILAPGERLIEDRLAEELGVSRNPIREAIRILESEGFLEVAARRGASVATLSSKQAAELFDVRLALEPLGARLAAAASESAKKPALARMRAILADVEARAESLGPDALSDLHSELHSIVFQLSDNAYLIAIALPMVKRGQWLLRQSAPLETPSAWSEHHGLISSIEEGDQELAEAQARNHVLSVRHQITKRLSSSSV
jgi:DNA-binding GntR family transcriptional regulator